MYVVYNVETLKVLKLFLTERGAKISASKYATKGISVAHCPQAFYDEHINIMTTTYSMMDPERKPIAIRIADKGGCTDPATETYWSM